MKINFILTECTFLRYFIPLIIECNNRNIKTTVFVGRSNKYNCPENKENEAVLFNLAEKYSFEMKPLNTIKSLKKEIVFCIEGCGINSHICLHNRVYSLTYMTDYVSTYKNYINDVHAVIFPSKVFAEKYNKVSGKNLYLGSPKYDYLSKSKKEIKASYDVPEDSKVALYIGPKTRDYHKVEELKIINALRSKGYKVFCKGRKKDPVKYPEMFDMCLYDKQWFPHTTIDLIKMSDLVINFDSTSIKEAILLKKPIINFCVKPSEIKVLHFLYDYSFCHNFQVYDKTAFERSIDEIIKSDYNDEFNSCINQHLFKVENTCNRIIDNVLQWRDNG